MTLESFTQPSRFDELIIGTQVPCTPGASQVIQQSIFVSCTTVYFFTKQIDLSKYLLMLSPDSIPEADSTYDTVLHIPAQCEGVEQAPVRHEEDGL